MEDKRKLTAAILGAITAYIQMEQQSYLVTPRVEPKTKTSGWKIPRPQELMKAKRVKR